MVRERLQRLQDTVQNKDKHAAKVTERILAIGGDCAARLKEPFRSSDHGDLFYDENGLPE